MATNSKPKNRRSTGGRAPARRGGLGQDAYQQLRDAILSGELAPNTQLSEVSLAERFRVSRTPVREALARLAKEGLVLYTPGRGSRVTEVSLTDIGELFQMRELLEGYVARLAAESPEQSIEIDRLIEQFTPYQKVDADLSTEKYYELASQLDETLIGHVRNQRLKTALHEVWTHTRRLRQFASNDPSRIAASAVEHVAILTAVRARDADAAELAVREHLTNSRNAIVSKLLGVR